MPQYHITDGVVEVKLTALNGETSGGTSVGPITVTYDATTRIYTVQCVDDTFCTQDFSHHIMPATKRILCGYVGRINFRVYHDTVTPPRNLNDMRAALADPRVAKLVLLNNITMYVNPDSTPKPGFSEQWMEETFQAYQNGEYWFQIRPQYESVLTGVDTTVSPHERFLKIRDQLSDDHFLPDFMPECT
jgi:hypothetical protein